MLHANACATWGHRIRGRDEITADHLESLARCCGGNINLVLCGGGSPCQDLSASLAHCQGLEGSRSKLFYEMPRFVKELKRIFPCPVYTFVENVASMTSDNGDKFTTTLAFSPYF